MEVPTRCEATVTMAMAGIPWTQGRGVETFYHEVWQQSRGANAPSPPGSKNCPWCTLLPTLGDGALLDPENGPQSVEACQTQVQCPLDHQLAGHGVPAAPSPSPPASATYLPSGPSCLQSLVSLCVRSLGYEHPCEDGQFLCVRVKPHGCRGCLASHAEWQRYIHPSSVSTYPEFYRDCLVYFFCVGEELCTRLRHMCLIVRLRLITSIEPCREWIVVEAALADAPCRYV